MPPSRAPRAVFVSLSPSLCFRTSSTLNLGVLVHLSACLHCLTVCLCEYTPGTSITSITYCVCPPCTLSAVAYDAEILRVCLMFHVSLCARLHALSVSQQGAYDETRIRDMKNASRAGRYDDRCGRAPTYQILPNLSLYIRNALFEH